MKRNDDELLISESAAVRVFNKRFGTDCKTMEDTVEYLRKHPHVRMQRHAKPKDSAKNPASGPVS